MFYVEALGGFINFEGNDLSTALGNTLVGILTVFVALVVMSFLINCLKIVPKLQSAFDKKNEPKQPVTPAPAPVSSPEDDEDEELSDDAELVAVITAAIMAFKGSELPADGFVVRSIRRR